MREKIVNKASEMFITLGFKSVTMDDIAGELGISKKTIYTHFKNKTDLVKEVTSVLFEFITHGIDCICELDNNPIEELYEIKKFVMMHLKNENSSPQYQLQKYYPEIFHTLKNQQFEMMQECTVRNLKKGVEQGLYRNNLNIEFVSRIYFIGVNGIKDDELFPARNFPKAQLMEEYLEYHLRGIVTKKGQLTLNKFINEHTND
jgi:AcrR family transcriptional regulator